MDRKNSRGQCLVELIAALLILVTLLVSVEFMINGAKRSVTDHQLSKELR